MDEWEAMGWIEHNARYDYLSLEGVPMTEVHALHFEEKHRNDLWESLAGHKISFGNSVRPPLIILGQDEAIFKQFLMTLME